ncbi:Uncharacterized protein APZ42_025898, partial [Daphnia magna]
LPSVSASFRVLLNYGLGQSKMDYLNMDFDPKLWTSPDGTACHSPYFRT